MKSLSFLAGAALIAAGCSGSPAVSSASGGSSGTGSPGAGGSGGSAGAGVGARDAGFGLGGIGGGTGGSGTGGASAGSPDAKNCGLETFKLEAKPAELLLILDRSGSMNDPADPMAAIGSNSKWTEVTAALNETIMTTQASVWWGLKMFPNGSADLACGVGDGVDVPSALNNYTKVWAPIMTTPPTMGNTPTTVAVNKAVAYLNANPSANARYLVLATDGEPNCGTGGRRGGGGFGGGGNDDAAAIQSVQDAATAGLKTFVIGIATSGDADTVLTQMAMKGGEPRAATPPYYPVAQRMDLINALGLITGHVVSCVFPLSNPPPSPNDVAVDVGANRVTRDPSHMNGWDYGAGNRSIEIFGAACDQVKASQGSNVQIIFGCPGVLIP